MPGRVVLTESRLYFTPFYVTAASQAVVVPLEEIAVVRHRRHQLKEVGIELFKATGASIYLALDSPKERDLFFRELIALPSVRLSKSRDNERMTAAWLNGKVSNLDYLLHL